MPGVLRQGVGIELGAQPRHRLVDPQIVELDALALRTLLAMPVGLLETLLGLRTGLPEQPVMPVEALQHDAGNVEGAAVGEFVGKHGGPGRKRSIQGFVIRFIGRWGRGPALARVALDGI